MIADMHTHSHHSHDSTCPVEEMCLAQLEKGVAVMAVTDHFDPRLSRIADDFEPIRQSFAEAVAALEINTSAYAAIGDFMPSKEMVTQYYNMGGRLITLGSDAHIAQNASIHFDKTKQMLKDIGFTKLYYYQNRKPVAYEIE